MSTITYCIPRGAGKFLCGPDPSPAEAATGNFEGILCGVSRRDVEACNTDRLVDLFGKATHPDILRQHRSNVRISVDGFSSDAREIYEIDEIRDFFTRLKSRYPCWSFFGDLNTPNLLAVVACMVPIHSIRIDSKSSLVTVDSLDIRSVFEHSLSASGLLLRASQINKGTGVDHAKVLADYLGIGRPPPNASPRVEGGFEGLSMEVSS